MGYSFKSTNTSEDKKIQIYTVYSRQDHTKEISILWSLDWFNAKYVRRACCECYPKLKLISTGGRSLLEWMLLFSSIKKGKLAQFTIGILSWPTLWFCHAWYFRYTCQPKNNSIFIFTKRKKDKKKMSFVTAPFVLSSPWKLAYFRCKRRLKVKPPG